MPSGGDERLHAEAKGRTTSPGLDVDTLYGQLLRRMKDPKPGVRNSVVVPTSALNAALRARPSVNRCLRSRRRRRGASTRLSAEMPKDIRSCAMRYNINRVSAAVSVNRVRALRQVRMLLDDHEAYAPAPDADRGA